MKTQSDTDITLESFNIRKGSLAEKKENLMKFVAKLVEDEVQQGKLKQKIKAIKEKRSKQIVYGNYLQGLQNNIKFEEIQNEIDQIQEIMKNPYEHDVESDEERYGDINSGVFVQRNLNIAPFYREYIHEKRKVMQYINYHN